MAGKIASWALLATLVVACSQAQKPASQNNPAHASPTGNESNKFSLYNDATMYVQKGADSTFAGVEISGKPFVIDLKFDPGSNLICTLRSFNENVEGESSSSFILLIGDSKTTPVAWVDNFPLNDQAKDNKVKVVDSFISSNLCFGKGTTSLLFDIPAAQLNQPKKFFLTFELTGPEEKKLSFQADLR